MIELEDLVQKRIELSSQMVVLMFQILALLLIPVAAALYGTELLDSIFHTGKLVAIPLVVATLSFSWISIWKIYTKVDRQMTELDTQILKLKISNGYDPSSNIKRQESFDKEQENI